MMPQFVGRNLIPEFEWMAGRVASFFRWFRPPRSASSTALQGRFRCLPCASSPAKKNRSPDKPSIRTQGLGHVFFKHKGILIFLIGAFVFLTAISYLVFDDYPLCGDEFCYLYQAQIFSKGRTSVDVTGIPEELREFHVIWKDGKAFSKYPPGFSLLLTLGVWIGAPGIVNPLISTATLAVSYFMVEMLLGSAFAAAAVILMLLNPYFVGYGSSYFSQPLALFLSSAALFFFLRYVRTGSRRLLCLLGNAIGMLVITRQLDALCIGTPIYCALAYRSFKAAKMKHLVLAFLPPVLFTVFLCYFNFYLTGRFSLSTFAAFESDFHVIDRNTHGFWDTTRMMGSQYVAGISEHMWPLIRDFFFRYAAYCIPILAIAGIFTRGLDRSFKSIITVHLVLLFFLYNFHPSMGWPQYGARYYYSSFISVIILATAALANIGNSFKRFPTLLRTASYSLAVLTVIFFQFHVGLKIFKEYRQRFQAIAWLKADINQHCPPKSIVVMRGGKFNPPIFVLWENFHRNPFYNGERIFVLNRLSPQTKQAYANYQECVYTFNFPPIRLISNSTHAAT